MNTPELELYQTPKAFIRWLNLEFLNQGDLSVADQLMSSEFAGLAGKGPEGFEAIFSALRHGFPNRQFTIQDLVVEDSRVTVRTSKGTHDGGFASATPTAREVSNKGIAIYWVEDGKSVEMWYQMDRLGVLQQIGIPRSIGRGGPGTQVTKSSTP